MNQRSGWRLQVRQVLALALGLSGFMSGQAEAALLDFSADEQQRIASHGPWPPAPARDAGNPVAGQAAAVALGQRLFFEPRLSPDGRLSCASCHVPALAFADGLPRSAGRTPLERNAPSLWNAVHERWYGWDGAADSLWSQALRPLLDPREMGTSIAHLSRAVATDAELSCRWQTVYSQAPAVDEERTLVQAGWALGAFVGSLVSGRSAFDRFRDALLAGDVQAAATYPQAAQRGLRLFVGTARCHLCHVGPQFSNGEFADIGLPFFVRPGVVDAGRQAGIEALRRSAYNLQSRWSSARDGPAAIKTRQVTALHRNFGEFKVPSLRNVAHTAPYMHDGQLATLADVVHHYSTLNLERLHADGQAILTPLNLSPAERGDLVAFLRSLSDPAALEWSSAPGADCRRPSESPSLSAPDPGPHRR